MLVHLRLMLQPLAFRSGFKAFAFYVLQFAALFYRPTVLTYIIRDMPAMFLREAFHNN